MRSPRSWFPLLGWCAATLTSVALASVAMLPVLRRTQAAVDTAPSVIVVGELEIDPRQRRAELRGEPLQLTRREFDVLTYLAERVGQVVSRRELLTEVWNQSRIGEEQTIDVHISWLRRKLGETAAAPRFLHTVRGVGVMMVDPQ